jgi:hypothetical protein
MKQSPVRTVPQQKAHLFYNYKCMRKNPKRIIFRDL